MFPFVPFIPLAPLFPFVPLAPLGPVVFQVIFFSVFLHFVLDETRRIVPLFFFWQALIVAAGAAGAISSVPSRPAMASSAVAPMRLKCR